MNPFALPPRFRRFQVEITTGCNLKCAGCQRTIGLDANNWRNMAMSPASFATVIANGPAADILVLQGIGEPTLHPKLAELLDIARTSGKYGALSFNTNALFREPSYYRDLIGHGLSHVSVSVDSLDPAIAEKSRSGTDAALLESNLRALIGLGLPLTVSVVLSRWNLADLGNLLGKLASMGKLLVEVQPLIGYDNASNQVVLTAADIAQARAVIADARKRHPQLSILEAAGLTPNGTRCRRPFHAAYATVEGFLTPCCTTNDVDQFGKTSLRDQSFAQAWQSEGTARWFTQFLDREPDICRGCSFNPSGSFAGVQAQAAAPTPPAPAPSLVAQARQLHDQGMAALGRGEHAAAETLVRAAIGLTPEPRFRNNLGCVLIERKRPNEAVDILAPLIREQPDYPSAYLSLAAALEAAGRGPEAGRVLVRLAERALAARNGNIFRQAFDRLMAQPEPVPEMARLGHVLRITGDNQGAVAVFDRLRAKSPDDLGLALARAVAMLPMLCRTAAEQQEARAAYGQALAELAQRTEAAPPHALIQGAAQVGFAKPFFLSYSGENDRELQTLYGRAVARMMQAALPQFAQPLAPPPRDPDGRLRIGFASAYLGQHSVSKLFNSWIERLDRRRFRVFVYNLNTDAAASDPWLKAAADSADGAYRTGGTDTAAWAQAIIGDRLHALIYPEVGMETNTLRLAALRLAPVQAMAWGHPVTSGLPTMDWFLTSDLMEPKDGDSHYTEKLLRLPQLSIHYRPVPQAEGGMSRADYGLGDKDVIYICCQTPYKYRPVEDDVPARIAEKVPNARFLFIGEPQAPVTAVLRERLAAAFTTRGLDASAHLRFVPPIPAPRFQAFLALGDVYLDSIAWSGGNTTLEAATVGLPMVTLAGPFMRGRHTTGILRRLGLDDGITETVEDYIALAVRMGREQGLRGKFRKRMAAHRDRLFEDPEPLAALADFLEREAMPKP